MTKPWTNEALWRVTEFSMGLCRLICPDLAFLQSFIIWQGVAMRDKSTNVPHSPNVVFITISWFYIWVCFGFTYNVLDLCERLWGDFGHENVGEFSRILSRTTPLLVCPKWAIFPFFGPGGHIHADCVFSKASFKSQRLCSALICCRTLM